MKRMTWRAVSVVLALGMGVVCGCGKGGNPGGPPVPQGDPVPDNGTSDASMQAKLNGNSWSASFGGVGLPSNLGYVRLNPSGGESGFGMLLQGIVPGTPSAPLGGSGIFIWAVGDAAARSFDLSAGRAFDGGTPGANALIMLPGDGKEGRGFTTDETHRGQLQITELDLERKWIRGTFYFEAVEPSTGEVQRVAEGSFSGSIDVVVLPGTTP